MGHMGNLGDTDGHMDNHGDTDGAHGQPRGY